MLRLLSMSALAFMAIGCSTADDSPKEGNQEKPSEQAQARRHRPQKGPDRGRVTTRTTTRTTTDPTLGPSPMGIALLKKMVGTDFRGRKHFFPHKGLRVVNVFEGDRWGRGETGFVTVLVRQAYTVIPFMTAVVKGGAYEIRVYSDGDCADLFRRVTRKEAIGFPRETSGQFKRDLKERYSNLSPPRSFYKPDSRRRK